MLIPFAEEGVFHDGIRELGFKQVHKSVDLLGGVVEGEFCAVVGNDDSFSPPSTTRKRLEGERILKKLISKLLRTSLTKPLFCSAWTLIEKVLNRALDFDARILHPIAFRAVAGELDRLVQEILLEILQVPFLSLEELMTLRLCIQRGGCGVLAAVQKRSYAHLAACAQILPAVGSILLYFGYSEGDISACVDITGAQHCIDQLAERSIFVRHDGKVVMESGGQLLTIHNLLWGQAHRMYATLSGALQQKDQELLRHKYSLRTEEVANRQLARLNSCGGITSGKWLAAFPASWWPECHDGPFVMALRFRCGLRVTPSPHSCMHASIKNKSEMCEKAMDIYGDYTVTCGIGTHIFTRHSAVNEILLQAGRAAGYVALSEQVIPELMQKRTESGGVQKFGKHALMLNCLGIR